MPSICLGRKTVPPESRDRTVTLGTNEEEGSRDSRAFNAIKAKFEKREPAVKVVHNSYKHETFKEELNDYLAHCPDDVIVWVSGERILPAADHLTQISDVWDEVSPEVATSIRTALTHLGEFRYFIPFNTYPWAVYYRKSLWKEKGYWSETKGFDIPKTWESLIALAKRMEADGIVPLAFGNATGWPAMGTFDILNLRINGFDFHSQLMGGSALWNGQEVKRVFERWKRLRTYYPKGLDDRTHEEATRLFQDKAAGMYFIGGFFVEDLEKGFDHDDIGVFSFPEIDPEFGCGAIDAPIDGFVLSKNAEHSAAARKLITYLGTAEAFDTYNLHNPGKLGVNTRIDTSKYTQLQKDSLKLVGMQGSRDAHSSRASKPKVEVSRFMNRDTRPDFAKDVVAPALRRFLRDPGASDSILDGIEVLRSPYFKQP